MRGHSLNPLDPTDFHPVCGISPWFPKISKQFPQNFGKMSKFKHLPRHIYLWKLNYFSSIRLTFSWPSKWYIGLLWAVYIFCKVLFSDMAGLGSIGFTWSNRLKIHIIPLYCVFTLWLGAGPSLLGGGLFNGSWGGGGAGDFFPTKWEGGKF